MTTQSKTLIAAQELLERREQAGLSKYGCTVDRTDLSLVDWLQHAIEEQADGLMYLIRAQQLAAGQAARIAELEAKNAALAESIALYLSDEIAAWGRQHIRTHDENCGDYVHFGAHPYMELTEYEWKTLEACEYDGGYTTGGIAERVTPVFGHSKRTHSAFVRLQLLSLERKGLVGKLDSEKPDIWVRLRPNS